MAAETVLMALKVEGEAEVITAGEKILMLHKLASAQIGLGAAGYRSADEMARDFIKIIEEGRL